MTTCGSCGARLQTSDRYCPACDAPNLAGPHAPKFRPRATDLPPVEERPRRLHPGGPACPRCGEDDIPRRAAYCPSCGMDLAGARRAAAFAPDHVTGVWTSPGPHNLDPYRPLRRLTGVLVAGLVVVIGLVVAWSVAQLVLYAKLQPRLPALPLDAEAARTWTGRLAVASAVAGLVVLLVTVAWTNRAYRNLPALAVAGLRFSPEVVPASWLVPGVNLIVPKLVLDELWRGSGPDEVPGSTGWRRRPVPFLSHLGWGVLMAGATGAILADLGLAADPGSDVDGLRLVLLLGAASGIAIALGVVLLGVFVTQIGDRQLERAVVLGPPEFVVVRAARWGRGSVGADVADIDAEVAVAPAADGTVPTPLTPPAMPRPGVVWGRY
ncbi:MAG: DUF4328 domain-containing protein [Acidimicrobiales bacterium]